MKYTKSFIPQEDVSFLNDSIAFGAFPSALFQPSNPKVIKPYKPPNEKLPYNIPSIQKPLSNLQPNTFNMNFPKPEVKLASPETRAIVSVSEKTGYNFISILKEFTDQTRIPLSFDYTPQINSFQCICLMNAMQKGQGRGSNKQEAKKEASKQTILLLTRENKQYLTYFSRFVNVERASNKLNPPPGLVQQIDDFLNDENIDNNLFGDNDDNEVVAYLNQYCQQKFQTNPTFEYEPSDNGYFVTLRCEKYEQKAEGPSKKAARQNAAKMLCEKLGVKIASQSIIDEITMKCQKLLKKTPLYTQMANTEDNLFQIKISCGNYAEIGIGRLRKDAKLQAAEKLMKRLDSTQKNPDFLKDSDDEISDLLNMEDKENFLEIASPPFLQKPISKPVLTDITNLRSKHQDIFLTYAEDKLSKLIPNPSQDKATISAQQIDIIRKYDELHLKPKKDDLNKLEGMFSEILEVLNSNTLATLKIDHLTPVGSYINNSLRNYKFELDVLAVHDPSASKNPGCSHKILIDDIKEVLEKSNLDEKYGFLTTQDNKKQSFLQITIEDEFKKHDLFHQIKIIPCSKFYPKLPIMLRCNMMMLKTLENMDLSIEKDQDLKILRRVLKCLKDNKLDELKGEIVDILIFNITRKFSEIDIIRNVQRFFEFVALGGLSCNKENQWFWGDVPEFFFDYVKAELSNEMITNLESSAKKIIEKGMDQLIKNFK